MNDSLTNDLYDESLWCNIWFGSNKILIGVIYRSPINNANKNQLLNNLLLNASQLSHCDHKLIVGDFKYPNIDWENFHFDARFDDFVETILDIGLTQQASMFNSQQEILLN